MKKRSDYFKPGQRVAGSMLTIVDSVSPISWNEIIVDCDCGNRVVLPYMTVYRGKFSCGCRRRLHSNSVDMTGYSVFSRAGNGGRGRRLTVLFMDTSPSATNGEWIYSCDCCGNSMAMPEAGNERGYSSNLKRIAGEFCPHFMNFYPANGNGHIDVMCEDVFGPVSHLFSRQPEKLAYFYKPAYVQRYPDGIAGFRGKPSEHLELIPLIQMKYAQRKKMLYRRAAEMPPGTPMSAIVESMAGQLPDPEEGLYADPPHDTENQIVEEDPYGFSGGL
jgi:hypothetical protein